MADDIRDKELSIAAAGGAATADLIIEDTPEASTTPSGRKKGNPLVQAGRFLLHNMKFTIGLTITVLIVAFGLIAPYFTQNPKFSGNPALEPPSKEHLLGTTSLGYDVMAQLAHGARGSLMVGLIVAIIAIVLSVFFGVVAGYLGGYVDEGLSLITNIMLVIPGLPLVIVISSYVPGRSLLLVALVLGVTAWAGSAVVLRSQARSLRTRDYVAAARVAGERTPRIILVEILPNLLPLFAAQFLFAVVAAILGEAGLSYLGLGPTGSITWGTMLNEAQIGSALTREAWWWFIPPGLLIAMLGFGLSLMNFAIDEIINPKLRSAPAAVKNVKKAVKAGKVATHSEEVIHVAPAADGGSDKKVGS